MKVLNWLLVAEVLWAGCNVAASTTVMMNRSVVASEATLVLFTELCWMVCLLRGQGGRGAAGKRLLFKPFLYKKPHHLYK